MRSIWKGAVSFGLVSIPVNMYSATESKNVAFHQVHEADAGRVHMKRVCSVDGEEVPYTEIAKGYETDDGRMVVLSADDFAGLPLPSAKTVEVLEFVPLQIIDPIYFDRSYFLEPQQGGVKAYLLLRDALRESGRVAIAKIAVRQRESLAVLRLYGDVMLLNTMLWPDEVRKPEFGFLERESPRPRPQELNMAETLISALAEESFEPDKYVDEYRTAVESLIEAKIAGNEVAEVTASSEGEVLDLMAALAASVKQRASADTAAAKTTGRKPKSAPRRRSPKTA
jgi:DNA end-binding protein Ku